MLTQTLFSFLDQPTLGVLRVVSQIHPNHPSANVHYKIYLALLQLISVPQRKHLTVGMWKCKVDMRKESKFTLLFILPGLCATKQSFNDLNEKHLCGCSSRVWGLHASHLGTPEDPIVMFIKI